MSKCANEKCKKDTLSSIGMTAVNVDGDLACSESCKKEYEKQRDHFFDNIGDDTFYNAWMNGNI